MRITAGGGASGFAYSRLAAVGPAARLHEADWPVDRNRAGVRLPLRHEQSAGSVSGFAPFSFPRPGVLTGPNVRLVPLVEQHREPLRRAAQLDESIWTYFPLSFNGAGQDFDPWFDHALARYRADEHFPFAVIRRSDDRVLGTTRFYDMAAIHRRLAVGSTWYVPEARGSLINAEVRWLTLSHAFEVWRVNRVELITDPRNLASRAAMKLLGAVQEGVIRRHLVYKDGRVRDSVLFSIVSDEWPTVSERLAATLGPSFAAQLAALGKASDTTST